MAVVGSAEVIVRAITNKVKVDIQKAFKDARPVIQAEGKAAGREYATAFGDSLQQRLGPQLKNAVKSATSEIEQTMTQDLSSASQTSSQEAGAVMERELVRAGGRAGGGAGGAAAASFGSVFAKDFAGAINRFMNLSSILDLINPAIANLVGALSAVVSGLFAMGAAAAQAAGALAVLPGIFGVLIQSFGAIKLATSGVGAAIQAGTKAQEAAASTANKYASTQVAAANRLTAANEKLKASLDALQDAQDRLNAARERDSELSKDLEISEGLLANAKKNLASVMGDPASTAAEIAEAKKAAEEAQNNIDQTTKAKQAQARKVKAAEDSVAVAQAKAGKAEKARNAAQKAVAAGGAQTPAVKAANAYADALAKLTPEAQAFVKKVLEMKEAFKVVGDEVARNFFPPLTQAMELIGSSKFFDILKTRLGETGGLLGQLGLDFAEAFVLPKNMSRFDKLLAGNNKILKVFTTSMKDLGGKAGDNATPVEHLVSLLLKLGQAVQPITKRFATWVATLIASADNSAKLGKNGNGLLGFFKRAGDRAAQLGRIFGNLFGIIGGLGKAAIPAGDSLLTSFEKATRKLEKFIKTPEQQAILTDFFDGVKTNMEAVGDLIVVIGDEFLDLGDNEGIASFSKELENAARNMGDLADKLTTKDLGKNIAELGTTITELFEELTQTGQMNTFLNTLDGIAKVLVLIAKGFNNIPFSGVILAVLAVNRAFSLAANILGFGKSLDNVKKKIKDFGKTKIKGVFGKGGKASSDVDPNADDDAEAKGKTVGEAFAEGIAEGIKGNEHLVITAADHLADKMHQELLAAAELMDEVGRDIALGLAEGIKKSDTVIIKAVDDMGDDLVNAIKARLGISSPSRVTAVLGEDTGEGFVKGLKSETDNAFRAGADLADAAADGARAGTAGAVAPGKATGKVVAATSAAAAPVAGSAAGAAGGATLIGGQLDKTEKKADSTAKKFGKLGGASSKLGGAFKGLGGGLMALTGGPFGLLLVALPLLITAFTKLYKESPAFRKFVDGIVKAVKPILKWLGEILIKVLDNVFTWVNTNLPKIGGFFSSVFGAITSAVGTVIDFVKNNWPILISIILGPFGLIVALIIKNWSRIRFAFKLGLAVAKAVLRGIVNRFTSMKDNISNVFGKIGDFFGAFRDRLGKMRDKVSEIVTKVKELFTGMKDSIGDAFSGLKDLIKVPINNVITFINDKFIGNLNKVTKKFGLTIPEIPGFAEGGWTGPGPKNKVAGVVHADEFVVTKAARRQIERTAPGALAAMNRTGSIPRALVPMGDLGDLAGAVGGAIKDTAKGAWNSAENLAKKGVGRVLEGLVSTAISGMGKAGIKRGGFINDLMYGIMDKLKGSVKSWGQDHQKEAEQKARPVTQNTWVNDPKNPTGKTIYQGGLFSNRFYAHLKMAEKLANTTMGIYQGGFRPRTSYSGTSHQGDAIDIKVNYALLRALRAVGIAAGDRTGLGNWAPHIHAVPGPTAGYGAGSALWQWQDYLRRGGAKQGPRSAWGLAAGGVALARPGGVHAVIAEAGQNERVEPLDKKGMSKRDKELLRLVRESRGGLSVVVNNPVPERASESVSSVLRRKGFDRGWG